MTPLSPNRPPYPRNRCCTILRPYYDLFYDLPYSFTYEWGPIAYSSIERGEQHMAGHVGERSKEDGREFGRQAVTIEGENAGSCTRRKEDREAV
eukprot:755873-Hanusia_phi.AAC.3